MSNPNEGEAGTKPPRPLITMDAYDGENTWDEWIGHFNSVSRVNDWNDHAGKAAMARSQACLGIG